MIHQLSVIAWHHVVVFLNRIIQIAYFTGRCYLTEFRLAFNAAIIVTAQQIRMAAVLLLMTALILWSRSSSK
jgi:hypothetical protein